MKTTKYRIPSYALPYLINGDCSEMEAEDIAMIDKWQEKHIPPNSHIAVGEEYGFCSRPAFGLACDCTDCEVVTMAERNG